MLRASRDWRGSKMKSQSSYVPPPYIPLGQSDRDPEEIAPNNGEVAADRPTGMGPNQWSSGICACFDDMQSCTLLCPPTESLIFLDNYFVKVPLELKRESFSMWLFHAIDNSPKIIEWAIVSLWNAISSKHAVDVKFVIYGNTNAFLFFYFTSWEVCILSGNWWSSLSAGCIGLFCPCYLFGKNAEFLGSGTLMGSCTTHFLLWSLVNTICCLVADGIFLGLPGCFVACYACGYRRALRSKYNLEVWCCIDVLVFHRLEKQNMKYPITSVA